MIDTLKLRSPDLDQATFDAMCSMLRTRETVDNATGELCDSWTFGYLEGSYEHRVSIRVHDSECIILEPTAWTRKRMVSSRACRQVTIEGSVHKAILGHNVQGGPCEPVGASRWFVGHVCDLLGVSLPGADSWRVQRIDWAEAFDLGDFETCSEYLHGLSLARFPRRKPGRWGDECVGFFGSTTAWKIYHKGPEFSKHDYRRLAKLDKREAVRLQNLANGILRVETSVKLRKLKADFGHTPIVSELTREYLETIHDAETTRVLRESETDMHTVRTHTEVKRRLYSVYPERLAGLLYGTWLEFSACGESEVRRRLTRPTFYRQRKQLQDAGVSWLGSDVVVRDCRVVDFSPIRADRRRLHLEDLRVSTALQDYAAAV